MRISLSVSVFDERSLLQTASTIIEAIAAPCVRLLSCSSRQRAPRQFVHLTPLPSASQFPAVITWYGSSAASTVYVIVCRFQDYVRTQRCVTVTLPLPLYIMCSIHCLYFSCPSVVGYSLFHYRPDARSAYLPVLFLLTGRFLGFSPRRGDMLHRSR